MNQDSFNCTRVYSTTTTTTITTTTTTTTAVGHEYCTIFNPHPNQGKEIFNHTPQDGFTTRLQDISLGNSRDTLSVMGSGNQVNLLESIQDTFQ